ncbi:NEAT domain-containing protein [Lacticaseibacillus nasuensis]|uniref:NEAT domain-containing protein n=1 Tax=Lacticaseibacillus nasuensis TaxID=944671 RepID=UPI00224802E0|nr:NEAT domain-containing protein [Lacticaseibacillus nasuensis]MCX2456385.1 NEAT domain-containing protein [Lacticaseibacillus nasuensis]
MKRQTLGKWGMALLLLVGFILTVGTVTPASTQAATTDSYVAGKSPAGTYQVPYTVNKAGKDTPSLANSFFSGVATVVVASGQPTTVTLHLQKYAALVKTFSIGDQAAKVTNATKDTADLTFTVDAQFAAAKVTATMSVMNMQQQADVVFATPLYAAQPSMPDLTQPGQYDVPFVVNKFGTDQHSVAAAFFSGTATLVVVAGKPAQVTLHLTKGASLVKAFAIGEQPAKVTTLSASAADLTFTVDDNFAAAKVTASMTVMNMHQQADILFNQALPVVKASQPSKHTKPSKTGSTKHTAPTKSVQPSQAHTKSLQVYQDTNGRLSTQPSAAQAFLADTATLGTPNHGLTQVTIHTTGAQYIDQMKILGRLGRVLNQHGDDADIRFTLPTAALDYALPVTFKLTVPGGVTMTQSAFVLVGVKIAQARIYPGAPVTRAAKSRAESGTMVARTTAGHALDPTKQVQTIGFSVLNEAQTGASNANAYFTHQAQVVKRGNGYDVYLTVRAAAGLVTFTPLTVANSRVFGLTKSTSGGQDVWRYAFHVANANSLDQPVRSTIAMSVPMAGINHMVFTIWFDFARTAGAVASQNQMVAKTGATGGLPAKKIALVAKVTQPAAKSPVVAATPGAAPLPQLEPYPLRAEIAGFAAAGLMIIGLAWFRRYH